MGKIFKLDKNLANQIAAGEVVERPVSVVKELVENAIDAKADFIKVEIKDGGKTQIIITDNGSGMSRDDLEICLEKYTTSKIKSLQDLYNVMTFGFRGEALSSISSVSKLSIITKTLSDLEGSRLDFETLKGQIITSAMAEVGTSIIVNELFYNTPARLNYLKQDKTEYLKILSYMQEVAFSYPEIGFEFISDDRQVFKYNKGEDLKTRIYQIYSKEVFDNVLDINFEMVGIKVTGYISDPKVSYANRNRQHIFVNSRPITSVTISKAISDAFNRFIPHGCYPFYVLKLDIDPTLVDVNVHPRKQEVRFANEQNIFRSAYHAVLNKLEKVSLLTSKDNQEVDNEMPQNNFVSASNYSNNYQNDVQDKYYTGSGTKFKSYSPYKDTSSNPSQFSIKDAFNFTKNILDNEVDIFKNTDENSGDLHYTKLGKIVGQTYNSYIVVENNKSIIIYDQHALAERIIYEKLLNKENVFQNQKLLIPQNIKLTPQELDTLTSNIDIIKEMGFDLEFMSNGIISINEIPDFVKKQDLEELFLGILNDVGAGNQKSNTLQEVKNKIFAYTACRSAIKFGNKLNLFEMNKLLNDAYEGYTSTCPHGRPVVFEINLDELKDKYER